MSKAKTFAIEWTEGDKTLESLTAAFERAIAYGRRQEREAIKRRVNKLPKQTENFDCGGWDSYMIMDHVRRAVDPE